MVSSNACHIPIPTEQQTRDSRAPLVVGLLANLSEEKGLNIAIETVMRIHLAGKRIKLILAGPIQGLEAERAVARGSEILGQELEVRGPVADLEKENFYRSVDVFLFPTKYRYEAQPLVIYEALSHGIPVISTSAGYIEEMLRPIGATVRLSSDVVDNLRSELLRFIEQPDELAIASQEARREFENAHAKGWSDFLRLCEFLSAGRNGRLSNDVAEEPDVAHRS